MSKLRILLLLSIIGSANAKVTQIASLKDFEKNIERDDLPSVIMFQSPSCPHCKSMGPIFDQADKKYGKKANFMSVDSSKSELDAVAKNYGIIGVPTIIYKEAGFKPAAEFNKTVESFLGIKAPKKAAPAKAKKKKVVAKK